jgi:hypothetical protein
VIFASWALVYLLGYGVVWLSVRGQQPHRAPAGWALALRALLDLGFLVGAGEGNRTLMTSLEGWGSTIELRPRAARAPPVGLGPARHHG